MKKSLRAILMLVTGSILPVGSYAQSMGCPTYTSTQSPTLCAGESITVGTHTYAASNTYTDTLTTVFGCDSIVTTVLTVRPPVNTGITLMVPTCGCPSAIHVDSAATSYQWVNCTTNVIVASGVGMQDYPVVYQGTYSVIINDNGCVDTSECVFVIATGINDPAAQVSELSIYPNPATDQFTISINTAATATLTISIADVLGASVYESGTETYAAGENKMTVPVSNISNGVYMIRISDGKNAVTKKMVISH